MKTREAGSTERGLRRALLARSVAAGVGLLGLVTGQDVPLPPPVDPEPLTDAQRRALTGEWEVGGGRLVVEDGGDHLRIHVEGQALLDRILDAPPGLRSLLAADTERARQVVGGAREGDVGRAGALVAVWKAYEERFGPMEEVEVLGSAPVWYYFPRASWLRFHFAGSDGTPVRRLHWSEDGNLTGIGGSVYPAPLTATRTGGGTDGQGGRNDR